jgi:hypothetical protein
VFQPAVACTALQPGRTPIAPGQEGPAAGFRTRRDRPQYRQLPRSKGRVAPVPSTRDAAHQLQMPMLKKCNVPAWQMGPSSRVLALTDLIWKSLPLLYTIWRSADQAGNPDNYD